MTFNVKMESVPVRLFCSKDDAGRCLRPMGITVEMYDSFLPDAFGIYVTSHCEVVYPRICK